MKLKYIITLLLFAGILNTQAQRKSDLLNEISTLKTQLDTTNTALANAKKKGNINLAKAQSYEKQVLDLQTANTTLLKNLNNFAQVSNKNSKNITIALESLEEKEAQLKIMNDAISSNDSTAVVVLANAKQTLGENAKISVADGIVTIANNLTTLFGEDGSSTITEQSKEWIGSIAKILSVNPEVHITIEGISMTGDFKLPLLQSRAIANTLINDFGVKTQRISTSTKDGGFKEGVQLKIHPNYQRFYKNVREGLKDKK